MRKTITVALIALVLFSSATVIAQSGERETPAWDGNMTDGNTANVAYLDGSYVEKMERADGNVVFGLENYYVYEWQPGTQFSDFETKLRENRSRLPYSDSTGMTTFTTFGNGPNTLHNSTNAHYVWNMPAASDKNNGESVFTTENGGKTIYSIANDNVNEDYGDPRHTDSVSYNGTEAVVIDRTTFTGYGQERTLVYYPESDTVNQISGTSLIGENQDKMLAFGTGKGEVITTSLRQERSLVIDNETGQETIIGSPVLEKANGYVVVATDNGINFYDNTTFVDSVTENGLANTSAERKFAYPEGVGNYERANFYGGYWFYSDIDNATLYAYNESMGGIEKAWNNAYGTGGDYEELALYSDGDTIKYLSWHHSGTAHVEIHNTGLQVVKPPSGCLQYLMPSDLTKLSEAQSVCWVPMFTGVWILQNAFQWIMLALLIAMPVAKVTRSDIATMATMDGVLLVGMLVGTLSPGFVAIGILTTVLLASYGRGNANITIDGAGGGEL